MQTRGGVLNSIFRIPTMRFDCASRPNPSESLFLVSKTDQLLTVAKLLARAAGEHLLRLADSQAKLSQYSSSVPREIKAEADAVLDQLILRELLPLGLPVLSEESGYIQGRNHDDLWFIVDPLDGTYNFVRNLGPSAVSIALWRHDQPVFGAIYDLVAGRLYWGGPNLGAYCDEVPIQVSSVTNLVEAAICTGFPARFDREDLTATVDFQRLAKPFGKVRMIGSAAMSLVNVANGSAEAYTERRIMLWDVAAGLAIVRGAGGRASATPLGKDWSCVADATNGRVRLRRQA